MLASESMAMNPSGGRPDRHRFPTPIAPVVLLLSSDLTLALVPSTDGLGAMVDGEAISPGGELLETVDGNSVGGCTNSFGSEDTCS